MKTKTVLLFTTENRHKRHPTNSPPTYQRFQLPTILSTFPNISFLTSHLSSHDVLFEPSRQPRQSSSSTPFLQAPTCLQALHIVDTFASFQGCLARSFRVLSLQRRPEATSCNNSQPQIRSLVHEPQRLSNGCHPTFRLSTCNSSNVTLTKNPAD